MWRPQIICQRLVAVAAPLSIIYRKQTLNAAGSSFLYQCRSFRTTPARYFPPNETETPSTATTVEKSRSSEPAGAGSPRRVLIELMGIIVRPMPIGDVFRSLSPSAKKELIRLRLPVEIFILHFPRRFGVFKGGRVASERGRPSMRVVPRYMQAQQGCAEEVELPAGFIRHPELDSCDEDPSPQPPSSTTLAAAPPVGASRVETVLQYIPNEWTPFNTLPLPPDVRKRCFGVEKPKQFFERHSKYFEVRQQGIAEHTFSVRRSLALQQAIAARRTT